MKTPPASPFPILLPLLLALVLTAGCRTEQRPALPSQDALQDSVLAVLSAVDETAFRTAYARLSALAFTRLTRTEQYDDAGLTTAFEEQVIHHRTKAPRYSVASTEAEGTFDESVFSRFAGEDTLGAFPDLAALALPEDPDYLSPRKQEQFAYRFLSDTLLLNTLTQVIEVRARPETADKQQIRLARFFIDRRSATLIGLHLERMDMALIFREESRFDLHLRPLPDRVWVPYNTRFHTRIHLALRGSRQFSTTSTYYNYLPASRP